MSTATIEVTVNSAFGGNRRLSDRFEAALAANAIGQVVLFEHKSMTDGFSATQVYVQVAAKALGLESKFEETDLRLSPTTDRTLMGSFRPKGKRDPVSCYIKIDGPPFPGGSRELLVELWENVRTIRAEMEAVRHRLWAKEQRDAEAVHRAKLPAGAVEVYCHGSEADGWIQNYRDGAGRLLRSPVGVQREGILYWMSAEDHAAAVAEHDERAKADADRAEKAADEAAQRASELATVVVPAKAVEAYRRYQGDDEMAWGVEDETASMLIRKYGEAIEAQGLGS